MIIDGRSLSADTTMRTSVCIVGAGPVGLTLAHELARHNLAVIVLESGAAEPDPTLQHLGDLEPSGTVLEPVTGSRRRQIGGMANLWNTYIRRTQQAARYPEFDEIDFERRDYLPYSGWPFQKEALNSYYRRAKLLCDLDPDLPTDGAHTAFRDRQLPFRDGTITTTVEPFGPNTIFTQQLPAKLQRSGRVDICTHATVLEVVTNEFGTAVDCVRVAASPATVFNVSAQVFVLACGGIDNARLLLLSHGVHAAGLGNAHDVVGRYFMDHHRIRGGYLAPFDRRIFERASLYDLRPEKSRYVMGKLTIGQDVMCREHMLNSSTLLWPRPDHKDDLSVDALKMLAKDVRTRQFNRLTARHLGQVIAGHRYLVGTGLRLMLHQRILSPNVSRGGWSYLPNNHRRFVRFELIHQVEQAPNPQNRVTLGATRDAFGLRRAQAASSWSDIDVCSIRRVRDFLAGELASNGIGSVVCDGDRDVPIFDNGPGMSHYMGTTRMHDDPKYGVVDADARVHGVANLYLAGGSVFPTGSYANPTLTCLALTLRLADTLATHLKHSSCI